MSFNLLSEPIRKFIYEKGWDELRPIQNAAISRILGSDENYILASRTASGKTEAAFLPILSKVDFNEPGVQVLYISPQISSGICLCSALCAYEAAAPPAHSAHSHAVCSLFPVTF